MYLIVIGWLYVVLMMSVAEATNSNGTVLGAIVTFVLYGLAPVALVIYLLGSPFRSKAIKRREAEAHAARQASLQAAAPQEPGSVAPDAGGHAAGGAEAVGERPAAGIPPVRKEP